MNRKGIGQNYCEVVEYLIRHSHAPPREFGADDGLGATNPLPRSRELGREPGGVARLLEGSGGPLVLGEILLR